MINDTYLYDGTENIELTKFAKPGVHYYQLIASTGSGAENIEDIEEVTAKSEVIKWERKNQFTITLHKNQTSDDYIEFDYTLNQHLNGRDYRVQLFDLTNNKRGNGSIELDKKASLGDDYFNTPGKQRSYVAALAKNSYDDLDHDEWMNQGIQDVEAIATSNQVTFTRGEWSTDVYLSKIGDESFLGVDTERGGGLYSTYLVDNSTNEIIWSDIDGDEAADSIDNRGNIHVFWATAYVAYDYREIEGEDQPTKLSDLKHIIANSRDLKDLPIGIKTYEEIIGSGNPSLQCNILCTGDPINNFTGEFFENRVDISIPMKEELGSFSRSYSTFKKDHLGILGKGWRSNLESKIISKNNLSLVDSDKITIENNNGSETNFIKLSNGEYSPTSSSVKASLKYNSQSESFTYEIKDNNKYVYSKSGELQKIISPKGQSLTISYLNGKISTVTDESSNQVTFKYKGNLLESISSNFGKTSSYIYNTNNQLTKVTDDKGVVFNYTYDNKGRIKTLTNELGGVTKNTYDSDNRIESQTDPRSNIISMNYYGDFDSSSTEIEYPNGATKIEKYKSGQLEQEYWDRGYPEEPITKNYSYDISGNIVSESITDGPILTNIYNESGDKIKEVDAYGNETNFEYDSSSNIIKVTDPLGNETINTYDDKKNLLSSTDPLGNKTSFTYDSKSNLTSIIDPRGNKTNANESDFKTTLSYTSKNMLKDIKNPIGNISEFKYDSRGRLIESKDFNDSISKIQYAGIDLPSKITDPLGNETALTYDNMGNVLTSKNSEGFITTYTYDKIGNLLSMKNPKGEITSYSYDSMNNLTTITSPAGSKQKIIYDQFDQPIEIIDEMNKKILLTYGGSGNIVEVKDQQNSITKYTYNGNGDISSVTSPDGGVIHYSYDENSNISKVTDALDRSTEYFYDSNNRLIEENKSDGSSVKTVYDEVGNIVKTINEENKEKHYTFDSLNRQTSYTNENNQTVTYEYDKNSNLTKQTRTDGSIVNYVYDARDLLTKIDYPGADSDITYTYDSIGRKTSEKKGSQEIKNFTYDSLNRITKQGEVNSEVSYNYDNSDNLSKVTYPSGRVVDYSYNAKNDLTKLTSGAKISSDFSYNKRGQQTQSSIINGVTEKTGYDSNGRLNSMDILDGTSTSLYKRTHKFNAVDEVSERGTSVNGSALNIDRFKYDSTSKLTEQNKASDDSVVNSYSYGENGTLNLINNKTQIFDDAGKITSSGDSEFNYDSRNNRISSTDSINPSSNVNYEWTVENFLKKVELGDSSLDAIEYEYDSSGLLKARTEKSNTDDFVWDINREIPVILSDGEYEYIYKADERVPFAQVNIDTDEVEYLHSDLNGSILAATDESGDLVDTVEYSPYGETSDNPVSNFGYAGEWIDQSTGYSYNKARWYDISTGTFLNEDPLVQLTQNAFGYTEGNPLTQIDPHGLFLKNLVNKMGDFISDENTIEVLGKLSTITGGIAAVAATVSVFVPAVAPFAGAVAGIMGAASFISGGAATIGNCINNIDGTCGWGVASTAASIAPFAKPVKGISDNLRRTSIRDNSKLNSSIESSIKRQETINAKFSYSAMQSAGFGIDRLGSAITKDKNEC